MDKCRIIDYTEEWRGSLKEYMHRTFPRKTDEYVDYCLDYSLGPVPSKIVINEKKQIVGCQLYFCTRVFTNGSVIDSQWGYDTYLDKEYRRNIGLDLVLLTSKYLGFGLGLSDINREIHKKMKSVFHEGVFSYCLFNYKISLSLFQKYFRIKTYFKPQKQIVIGNDKFILVNNVHDIHIPNDGFWYKDYYDIDFVRDNDFLNQRFFNNKVFKYYVYVLDSPVEACYFIVRETSFRGFPALTMSDFRFSPQNEKMPTTIIKAALRLAKKSNLGVLLFFSGDKRMQMVLKHYFVLKKPIDFVTDKKIKRGSTFSITGADSDADFNR